MRACLVLYIIANKCMLVGDFFAIKGVLLMDKSIKSQTFLSGPILPPLIHFAIPLMLSLFLQALYGGVDLAVVGQFAPTASISAVGTGSQVMQAVTSIITGLTVGVTVLVGKAVGAGDMKAAGQVVVSQIKLFTIMAAVLTVFMLALAPQIATVMNVPEAARDEAIRYIRICSAGIVFITGYNGISGVFRGIGNSRSPFIFVCIACFANVVLDLVFVGVFHMNASGAALATVISQMSSVIFSLIYIKRRPLPFSIKSDGNGEKIGVSKLLKIGAPIALQDFLTNTSFLIITSFVNVLGVVASASIGISEKLFLFLAIVPMAFMSALSTAVAQNIGAGKPERAKKSLFALQKISMCFGVVIFLLTHFAGGILASIFDSDPEVIEATALYLKGSSFEYLLTPLLFCFLGYLNGREHTVFVMAQGLLTAFLVRVPLSYFLSRLPGTGMFIISLAVPISGVVALLICTVYFIILTRKDARLQVSSEND